VSLGKKLKHLATATRSGDLQAREQFAQLALQFVTPIARERLHGNRLSRWIDASDIAQVVVFRACFQIIESETHEEVVNWCAMLRRMTLNAITDQSRRSRYDLDRLHVSPFTAPSSCTIEGVADSHTCVSSNLIFEESLENVRSRIPTPFLPIWQLRLHGHTWKEIGLTLGRNPHALRVRFNEMLKQVVQEQDIRD